MQQIINHVTIVLFILVCTNDLISQNNIYLNNQLRIDNFDDDVIIANANLVIGLTNSSSDIDDLSPLSNLEVINGNLVIMKNDNLFNLMGLENLRIIRDTLKIFEQINFTDLTGINNLESVGAIEIHECTDLENLDGLENLLNITDRLYLYRNDNLMNIDGLTSLDSIGGEVRLSRNDKLEHLDGFSNLKSVNGNLIISGRNLSSLEGLGGLTAVGETLGVGLCSRLKTFSGLNNISTVGGNISINYCDSLVNLDPLSNISSIGESILIDYNPLLTNLDGLSSINSTIEHLSIRENESLINIDGLQNIQGITQSMSIRDNPSLETINALSGISSSVGSITIDDNDLLTNLDPLSNITSVNGSLLIRSNNSLENINGLSNIENINGKLNITGNVLITDVNALSQISAVEDLVISGNINLQNIFGLRNIIQIDSHLTISYNDRLLDIDPLSKVTSLGDYLRIRSNDNLRDLAGLKNLTSVGDFIYIANNDSLHNCCAIHQLIETPSAVGGNITIENNPNSCSSIDEILGVGCIDGSNGVFGTVFFDSNMNMIRDQDEYGVPNIKIYTSENTITSLTDNQGRYARKVEEGVNYQLSIDVEEEWNITTDSSSFSFEFIPNGIENYDFGIHRESSIPSASVIINSDPTRCNTEVEFYLRVLNDGYIPLTGVLEFHLDSLTQYVSSNPLMIEEEKSLKYQINSLQPFQTLDIVITLDMPSEQLTGSALNFTAKVHDDGSFNPIVFDSTEFEAIVLCSYDPNDKQVNPIGIKEENYTLISEVLYYTIRFQNTGNDVAINVKILDTLDASLDIETLEITNSSHAMRTNLDGPSIEFRFDDINLIDSIANEQESHGFVQYKIKPNPEIAELTEIHNTAHIIFDFNPAIITNTTRNTMVETICQDQYIEEQVSICEGEEYLGYTESGLYEHVIPIGITCDSFFNLDLIVLPQNNPDCILNSENNYKSSNINVFPNPVTDYIHIKGIETQLYYELYDVNGKVVLRGNEMKINVNRLKTGIYILRLSSANISTTNKIIKI